MAIKAETSSNSPIRSGETLHSRSSIKRRAHKTDVVSQWLSWRFHRRQRKPCKKPIIVEKKQVVFLCHLEVANHLNKATEILNRSSDTHSAASTVPLKLSCWPQVVSHVVYQFTCNYSDADIRKNRTLLDSTSVTAHTEMVVKIDDAILWDLAYRCKTSDVFDREAWGRSRPQSWHKPMS